jgi:hypothetical protein
VPHPDRPHLRPVPWADLADLLAHTPSTAVLDFDRDDLVVVIVEPGPDGVCPLCDCAGPEHPPLNRAERRSLARDKRRASPGAAGPSVDHLRQRRNQ